MNLKKIKLAIVIFMTVSATAIAQTTTIDLEGFEEIKVFDQVNVTLVKSNKNQAVITGDDVDEVKIVNDDGRLKIRMELDNFMDGNETNITLYHSENLTLVDANEGANIKSDDTLDARYIVVRAQEGGEITAAVDTRNMESKAVTGGKLYLSGTAQNQNVMVRTGGEFHAKDVNSERVDVTIMAGGKAHVSSGEYAEASVTAGGTIEIFGNPETVVEDKTLGGSIIVHEM